MALINVQILKVVDASQLWVKEAPGVDMSSEAEQFHKLSMEIQQLCGNDLAEVEAVTNPVRGQVCLGRRSSDKKWYRVKVQEVMTTRQGTKASCFLLDYAEKEMIPLQWLREAPRSVLRVPPQAKECVLWGIQPLTMVSSFIDMQTSMRPCKDWDISATNYMKKLVTGSVNRQVELMKADDKGCLHIRLYMKDTLTGDRICINDKLVENEYAAHMSETPEAQEATADRIRLSSSPALTTEGDGTKGDGINVNKSPVSFGRGVPMNSVLQMSPRRDNRQTLLMSPKSPPLVTTTTAGMAQMTKSASPQKPDLAETRSVAPVPKGRGLALLQGLRGIQPKVGAYSEGSSLDPLTDVHSPPTGSVQNSTDDARAVETTEGVRVTSGSPEGQGMVKSPRARLPTHFLAAQKTAVVSTPPHGTINTFRSSPTGSSQYPENRPSNIVVTPNGQAESPQDVTVNDRSPGSGHGAVTKHSARLPTHFLAAQQKAVSTTPPQGRTNTPPSATKVRFSDSDDMQPSPTIRARKLQSILKRSQGRPSSGSEAEDATYSPTDRGLLSQSDVKKSSQQHIDSEINETTSRFNLSPDYLIPQQYLATQNMPTLSVEDYGVFVHGHAPRPMLRLDDAPFVELVKRILYSLEITRPRIMQSFTWPVVLRGLSMVGVAPPRRGGKTFAYLLPLINELLQGDSYKGVPAGSGPLCVIVCSSWNQAVGVFEICDCFLGNMKKCRTAVIYGGGAEDSLEVHLINGCELLVCTPNSLLRMLKKNITSLDRLCHLVLDDADILTEELREPVREMMSFYTSVLKRRGSGTILPHQLLLFASQWTVGIERFMRTYMPDGLVLISSQAEAAVFGQVRQMAVMCKSDQRVCQLLGLLDSTAHPRRTVVFTQRISEAKQIYNVLQSRSMYTLLIHHEMAPLDIERVQRDWNIDHTANSLPVLVVTGDALREMTIRNASCVVHYSLPSSQQEFGRRLWCMVNKFVQPFGDNSGDAKGMSYLLVTEECRTQAPYINKVLESNHADIPQGLHQMAAQHIERKSLSGMLPLCAYVKAFGCCRDEKRCNGRHVVFEGIDAPGKHLRCVTVPNTGHVKVLVTYVLTASCYVGHLLEHTSRTGEVMSHAFAYHKLVLEMSLWFSSPKNRQEPGQLKEGGLYAAEDLQHTFHRVLLTRLFGASIGGQPEYAQVEFVDNGGSETFKTEQLYDLPTSLSDVPFQGVELFCCRIRPVDNDISWTDKASVFVSELIEGKELEGNIVLSLGSSLWLDPMVKRSHLQAINVTINETCIRTQLLQNELANENPQHLHLLYGACQGRLSLPDNPAALSAKMAYTAQGLFMDLEMAAFPDDTEYVSVFVSAVAHPDLIYVQLTADKDRLLDLTDAIDVHVKLSPFCELKHIDCGLLVLAKFIADERWYRAKVVAVGDNDTYDVFFVDTGEQEWRGCVDLQALPMKFQSLPFQAIECNLYHLEPPGDEWTDSVEDFLWDITRANHDVPKILMAQALQKTEPRSSGQYRYTIKLYDTSKEYDLEIGQFLVAKGYARPSSTLVQELIPDTSSTEQLGFFKIPTLCAQILRSQKADETLRLATGVQHLITVNQRRKDAMREAGVAECLCRVLVYLASPQVVSVIVTSLTFFALNNDRNCEAVDKAGVVNTICVLLDQMTEWDVQEPLCRVIRLLANNHTCRVALLRRGALRILAAVVQSHVTTSDKLLDITCDAVCHLVTELIDSDIVYITSSRCIEALCACLMNTANSAALTKCVTALTKLAAHSQLRDAVRKFGGVKALCRHLATSTSIPLLELTVQALTNVANGNRFNKDEMVTQDVTDTLQRLSADCQLSETVRTQCAALHGQLARIIAAQQGHRETRETRSGQSNTTSHQRTKLKNKPLPAKYCSSQVALRSAKPDISWHQDRWNVLLTVQVKDVRHTDNLCTFSQDTVTFRTVVDSTEYEFSFHLYELIVPAKCEVAVNHSDVKLGLRKVSVGCWPRLLKLKQMLPYLRTDFEKYIDSDSDSDTECRPPLTLARRNIRPTVPFGSTDRSPISITCRTEESWDSDSSNSDDSSNSVNRDHRGYFQL